MPLLITIIHESPRTNRGDFFKEICVWKRVNEGSLPDTSLDKLKTGPRCRRGGVNMSYKIGKKEYDITQDSAAARFVELQAYFQRTQGDEKEACQPYRPVLVTERNRLAAVFGVKWHTLPRLVREYIPPSQYGEM